MPTSSSWLNTPVSRLRVTSLPNRSSPGSRSFALTSSSRNTRSSSAASSCCCGVLAGRCRTWVRTWKNSRWSSGTPSSSQMTLTGTGIARSVTRSAPGPAASIASIRSSTICWMRGRSSLIRRRVNSLTTMRRGARCSGRSRPINVLAMSEKPLRSRSWTGARRGKAAWVRSALTRLSASSARMSACRVTSHACCPVGNVTFRIGWSARSRW